MNDPAARSLQGMQSFDLDFPSGLNSYITAPQLGEYMIQYVDHFNLRRFFRRLVYLTPLPVDSDLDDELPFYASFYLWNKDDTCI